VADATAEDALPTIPEERRGFKDDGIYRSLAQVPARPVNMPTFAEAAAIENTLKSDQSHAKATGPDTVPGTSSGSASAAAPAKTATIAAAPTSRLEDRTPCFDAASSPGQLAVTLRFQPGSAALTSDNMANLVESLPTVRASTGVLRVFGHGDTETGSVSGAPRFDLATARAGAVAQALAGYGIPVSRMAIGVACADTGAVGESVQLFAQS
jgi:outer membrane protein OmpA-like peptidoglycan-associated protein